MIRLFLLRFRSGLLMTLCKYKKTWISRSGPGSGDDPTGRHVPEAVVHDDDIRAPGDRSPLRCGRAVVRNLVEARNGRRLLRPR